MADNAGIVQRIATKALIINESGQILFLREASTYLDGTNIGKYHLPGGRLNPGEALTDGLMREVQEETGLSVEIGDLIYADEWRPVIRGIQNQIVGLFFVCKPKGSNIVLSEEHDHYVWVTPGKKPEIKIMSPEDKALAAYEKLLLNK